MPYLFTYGTLQDPQVQVYVFGRTLEGQPEELPYFKWYKNAVYGRYPLVKPSNQKEDMVKGMAYKVSEQDLERCDVYETSAYTRKRFTLKSGIEAWVYVSQE